MNENSEIRRLLEAASAVLLRCVVLGFALLLLSFALLLVGGDMAHGIHGKLFEITKHEFDLVIYCGLGLFKILVFVLFLIPYVATRLVIKKLS